MNAQGGITQRMCNMYRKCTPEEKAEGRAWYDEASTTVMELSVEYGVPPDTVAGVIATLSPNISWEQNVRAADIMLAHSRRHVMPPMVAGYTANRHKAWAVLLYRADVRGPKVTAFKRAMLGDVDAVTLDRWMFRIGFGKEDGTVGERRILEAATRSAARICGETPRDMQAILWVKVRRDAKEQ